MSKRVKVEYRKTFVSGLLKGLTVDAHFSVPNEEHAVEVRAVLQQITPTNPKRAAITHDLFYVTDVR